MQFLVIGKDGKDEKAMERRIAVRKAHLKLGDEMEASGERWYGCVMLDDNGKMIGSMAVMDFPWKFNRPQSFFESREKLNYRI